MLFDFTLLELLKKVISRLKYALYDFKVKRVHLRHRRNHMAEYQKYDNIIKRFRSSGGLKNDFQAYKLHSLVNLLNQEKPKSILELGTGTSTMIFKEYVSREDGACLTSIDESMHWLDNTRELSGITKDDKDIELIYAPRIYNIQVQPKETRYDYKFDKYFDFVFIDGPSLTIDGIRDKTTINTNIFDIVRYKFPKVIVVDIRKATVEEIIKRVGAYYDIYISDIISRNIRGNYRYFSIFKLKEIKCF